MLLLTSLCEHWEYLSPLFNKLPLAFYIKERLICLFKVDFFNVLVLIGMNNTRYVVVNLVFYGLSHFVAIRLTVICFHRWQHHLPSCCLLVLRFHRTGMLHSCPKLTCKYNRDEKNNRFFGCSPDLCATADRQWKLLCKERFTLYKNKNDVLTWNVKCCLFLHR